MPLVPLPTSVSHCLAAGWCLLCQLVWWGFVPSTRITESSLDNFFSPLDGDKSCWRFVRYWPNWNSEGEAYAFTAAYHRRQSGGLSLDLKVHIQLMQGCPQVLWMQICMRIVTLTIVRGGIPVFCANNFFWFSVVPSILPVILLWEKEYNWREGVLTAREILLPSWVGTSQNLSNLLLPARPRCPCFCMIYDSVALLYNTNSYHFNSPV